MAKCGTCTFKGSETEYLAHSCTTGFVPTDPRHLGKRFLLQSKAALKRTGSLNEEKTAQIDAQIAEFRKKPAENGTVRRKKGRR